MTGQVYAVASGKGGVGKTTTVVNLGVTLRANDHSVVLVDADLGMPNLATFLGMDGDPTIHDVLAGEASVGDALIEEADGFAVLPGSRDISGFAAADPGRLSSVIEDLTEDYEYVLVDTGAGLSYEDVLPLGLVDGIVLVTTPDPAAVDDTERTGEVADFLGGHVAGVVITHTTESTDAEAIAGDLGADLLGVIPGDPTVVESTADGRPLEAYAPDSPAAEAYRRLAIAFTEDAESPAPDATAMDTDHAAGGAVSAPDSGGESTAPDGEERPTVSGEKEGSVAPGVEEEIATPGAAVGGAGDADEAEMAEGGELALPDEDDSGNGFFARIRRLFG